MLSRLNHLAIILQFNDCVFCQQPTNSLTGICTICSAQLPRMCPRSFRHLLLEHAPPHGERCFRRQRLCIAVWRYHTSIRWLINRFKESGNSHWARLLALQLSAQVLLTYRYHSMPLPDYLVAMPSTVKDWLKRGFHPAGLIAHHCGCLLSIPVAKRGLLWIKRLDKQKYRSRQQRWQSRIGAIKANRKLSGQSIAVIDDICTTGASFCAASEALHAVGARSVDVWSLAYNLGASRSNTSLLAVSALE